MIFENLTRQFTFWKNVYSMEMSHNYCDFMVCTMFDLRDLVVSRTAVRVTVQNLFTIFF